MQTDNKKVISGKAFVAGDNIDTDQIIPAEFLSYNPADAEERRYFGMYAMSGLPQGNVPFVADGEFHSEFAVIIGGRNFGCGSSREHAPLAIAEAGCRVVIAESYARIFYRNSINGGYLVPLETAMRLVDEISTGDEVSVNTESCELANLTTRMIHPLKPLGNVGEIVQAGGVFEYARQSGII